MAAAKAHHIGKALNHNHRAGRVGRRRTKQPWVIGRSTIGLPIPYDCRHDEYNNHQKRDEVAVTGVVPGHMIRGTAYFNEIKHIPPRTIILANESTDTITCREVWLVSTSFILFLHSELYSKKEETLAYLPCPKFFDLDSLCWALHNE